MLEDDDHADSPDEMTEDKESASEPRKCPTPEYKKKRRNELSKEEKEKKHASKKVFQSSWCEEREFKGWLKTVNGDPHSAFCSACDVVLKCGKSDLQKHASGSKHLKNVKAVKGVPNIANAFAGGKDNQHKVKVKTAEIALAAVFAEHNVSLQTADHVIEVFKKVAPDSKIIQDATLDRTKCTAIIKNVIAKVETQETVAALQDDRPFSVLVDESTDIAMKKIVCVLVKYIDPVTGRIRTKLLQLVEVDAKDCSAEKLYEAFKKSLTELGVPVKNVIGLGCDNCNTMVGRNNSFWTRLKQDAPAAVLMNCICHSSALVARESCAKLPSNVKKLLQDTSTYTTGSPKRCAQLEEFQDLYETEYGKLKKLSFTRWLVLQPCVDRYLKIYKVLLGFFELAAFENPKDEAARTILCEMKNPFTIAYLHFLNYVLPFFNKFNALFQSHQTLIHQLVKSSHRVIIQVCQNFVKPELLSNILEINVADPSSQVSNIK